MGIISLNDIVETDFQLPYAFWVITITLAQELFYTRKDIQG